MIRIKAATKLVTEPWRVARNFADGIPFLIGMFRFFYAGTRRVRWEVDLDHDGQVVTHAVAGTGGESFAELGRFVRGSDGESFRQMRLMPLGEDGEPVRERLVAFPREARGAA